MLVALATGCSTLKVENRFSDKIDLKQYGGRQELELKSTNRPPVILSATAIDDMESLRKPTSIASSTELWFW